MPMIPPRRAASALCALAATLAACGTTPPVAPETPTAHETPGAHEPPGAPAAPPRPTDEATFGTAAPFTVEAVGVDARWVALCQAREDDDGDGVLGVRVGYHGDTMGDVLRPYLIVDGGPGLAIDAYVDSTPDGRWLAYVDGGALRLWDSATNRTIEGGPLGASAGAAHPLLPPAWGGFDDTGAVFLFYRHDLRHGRRAFVLDLTAPDAPATPLPRGFDALVAAVPLSGGRHAVVATRPAASGPPGLPSTSLAPARCRGPITSYSTSGGRGMARAIVRVDPSATEVAVDDLLTVRDGRVLLREPSRALAWRDGAARTEVAPASCDGYVDAVGLDGAVLVACWAAVEEGRPALRWVAPDGAARELGSGPTMTRGDGRTSASRWWATGESGETWLLDLQGGRLRRVPGELRPIALHAGRWLLADVDARRAAILDPGADAPRWLPHAIAPYQDHGQTDAFAWFTRGDGEGVFVVDLGTGDLRFVPRAIGVVAARAPGHVLAARRPRDERVRRHDALPVGPLRWLAGAPPARTADP